METPKRPTLRPAARWLLVQHNSFLLERCLVKLCGANTVSLESCFERKKKKWNALLEMGFEPRTFNSCSKCNFFRDDTSKLLYCDRDSNPQTSFSNTKGTSSTQPGRTKIIPCCKLCPWEKKSFVLFSSFRFFCGFWLRWCRPSERM